MDCVVVRPFQGAGKLWTAGETVPAAVVEGWRNRRMLIAARYLRPTDVLGAAAGAKAPVPPATTAPRVRGPRTRSHKAKVKPALAQAQAEE